MTLVVMAETAADGDRLATMLRVFVVAALLVGPYGVLTARRIRRERAAAAAPPPDDPGETAADPAARDDDLARVVAEIDGAADRLDAGDGSEVIVTMPDAPTLDGRPVDATLAARLIGDALAQSGLSFTRDEASTPARLVLRRPDR